MQAASTRDLPKIPKYEQIRRLPLKDNEAEHLALAREARERNKAVEGETQFRYEFSLFRCTY